MTGVFVHLLFRIDLGPRYDGGPRLGPRFGIFDPEFVIDGFRIDAAEALSDTERVGIGILIDRAIVRSEIGGFHNKRIAFPVPTRVAEPLLQVLVDVRPAVERNHASTM